MTERQNAPEVLIGIEQHLIDKYTDPSWQITEWRADEEKWTRRQQQPDQRWILPGDIWRNAWHQATLKTQREPGVHAVGASDIANASDEVIESIRIATEEWMNGPDLSTPDEWARCFVTIVEKNPPTRRWTRSGP